MKDDKNMNYVRPNSRELPPLNLPFYAFSTGEHTTHPGADDFNREISNFVEIVWSIKGIGEIQLYDRKYEMHSNDVFFYLPGEVHLRQAISPEWRVRWLCFDGPFAESIMLAYRYARCQHASQAYPAETFAKLEELITNKSAFAIRECCSLILHVLACAGGYNAEGGQSGKILEQAFFFIASHLSDPELDVQFLCDRLNISKSKLTRLFNQEIGISPGRYILNCRLEQAQALLTGTDEPIGMVAERCGFADGQSFLKFIRRSMGGSPLEIRKRYSSHRDWKTAKDSILNNY